MCITDHQILLSFSIIIFNSNYYLPCLYDWYKVMWSSCKFAFATAIAYSAIYEYMLYQRKWYPFGDNRKPNGKRLNK